MAARRKKVFTSQIDAARISVFFDTRDYGAIWLGGLTGARLCLWEGPYPTQLSRKKARADAIWPHVRDSMRLRARERVLEFSYLSGDDLRALTAYFLELFRQFLPDVHRRCAESYFALSVEDRPKFEHRESFRGMLRLHRADGPCVEYPDGMKFYAWHGVRVPARLVEQPESISVHDVDDESNVEVKRVMIERFGGAKTPSDGFQLYMQRANARVLCSRGDYQLIWHKAPHLTSGRMVAVRMLCPSTGACFLIRVPPNTKTVEEGMNWIKQVPDYFGMIEHQT